MTMPASPLPNTAVEDVWGNILNEAIRTRTTPEYIEENLPERLTPTALSAAIAGETNAALYSREVNAVTPAPLFETPPPVLQGIGDSLTFGGGAPRTWMMYAASTLGWAWENHGLIGQTAAQVAARMNALPALLTFPSNQIPASGGVTVTANVNPLGGSPTAPLSGTVTGVRGQLSISGSTLTFTRQVAGTAVPIGGPVRFVTDEGESGRYGLPVFWVGRNAAPLEENMRALAQLVASRGTSSDRFLIIPPPQAEGLADVADLQRAIKAAYPMNVLDVPSLLLTTEAATAAAITFDANDLADIANGWTPRAFRNTDDPVHLKAAGNQAVGHFVAKEINRRGWNTLTPPLPGATGRWWFDDLPTGSNAVIPSMAGPKLTPTGATIGTATNSVQIALFDATSERMISDTLSPVTLGSTSFAIMFKLSDLTINRVICGAYGMTLNVSGSGTLSAHAGTTLAGPVPDTNWHTVVVTRTRPAETTRIYLDGVLVATGAAGSADAGVAILGTLGGNTASFWAAGFETFARALTVDEATGFHAYAKARTGYTM